MVTHLIINNNYVTSVFMEAISDMKCQFHRFHLEKCIIQQKQKNIYDIIVGIYVPLLHLRDIFEKVIISNI